MARFFAKTRRFSTSVLTVLLSLCFAMGFTSCTKTKAQQKTLTVAVTDKTREPVARLAAAFEEKNSDVKIILREFSSEEEKNYYLSHGAGGADLYTFDYALVANEYKEKLYALDRVGPANRYLVSIVNQLRDEDRSLYVLPSDGYCYSICYNVAKLSEHRLEVPETMSDLVTLSVRLKRYIKDEIYASSSTIGGKDSVLFALMGVAYPLYLNTVSGTAFLNGYLTGDMNINDEVYREEWTEIFERLKLLYDNGFYSLSDLDKTAEEGAVRFESGNAYAMQNSSSITKEEDLAAMKNVVLSPFVGNSERDSCFGSRPMMYLSVAKESGENGEKLATIKRLLNYFSTEEGQTVVRGQKEGEQGAYVSYFKNVTVEYNPIYAELQQKISEGRLFVTDRFHYVFSLCTDDIIAFLSGEKNSETLLSTLDEKIENVRDKDTLSLTEIAETLPFDKEETYRSPSALGDYFANAFLYSDYIDAAIYPSEYIQCPLFSGTLSETELKTVFPEKTMAYVRLPARDFVDVYNAINEKCYPVTAKVTVTDNKVYRADGKEIPSDELLYALIPAEYSTVAVNGTFGREQTSTDLLIRYLQKRQWRSEEER